MMMKLKSLGIARMAALAGLIFVGLGCQRLCAEPQPYIEPEYGPRYFLGDEETRLGRAHFLHGDYGLAEAHFQSAVETNPRNGAAWIGLAASYDRLGRFDLADRAYRRATLLTGANYVILNNHGYSYMLRGDRRRARALLYRANEYAPNDPTILNNMSILDSKQGYFSGNWP